MIRLPGLLDASLAEVARLHPTAASVSLKMVGASEATITIPEDSPTVSVHDWVSIYTQCGFAGIFRVSNAAQTYRKQIDLTLLHGIDILSDSVWADQLDFDGTKAEFIWQLLAQQTHLINGQQPWILGACEDTGCYEKSINYDRLSNLFDDLVEEGGNYYFTYDQTTFPWRVNFVRKSAGTDSEFRLTRNVRTATVTYNDADLCTRLHLSVSSKTKDADTEVTSTDTVVRTYNNEAAQAIWGIVAKTADIDTKDDIAGEHFANADEWAQHFLAARAEPSVQIQIDGDELSEITGDTWDELSIGKMCQVALPLYGSVFLERVVSVTYPDFLRDKSRVTVSLANTLPRFSESIASAQKTASAAAATARGASRGGASAKELTTWSQHVKYYGEALDGTGILTLYESGIDMDATSGVKIFSLTEGVQSLYAGITVNSSYIESLVQKTGINDLGESESLYTRVTQTASDITSLAEKTGVNALGENETLASRIAQNASSIALEVQRASDSEGTLSSRIGVQANRIDLVVNGSGDEASIKIGEIVDEINSSAVQISGSKIYLNGNVIADYINANSTEINNLKTGVTKASLINATSVVADNLNGGTVGAATLSIGSGTQGGSGMLYYRGRAYYRQGLTLGGAGGSIAEAHFLGDSSATVNLDHYHEITATEGTGADAGKIVITLGAPSSTEGTANFNIAATTAYKNGVLAARNAVKINPFTADAVTGATPNHRTFTYTTDAPTPSADSKRSDTWYLSGGTSWSDNKTSVGLHYGSASGTTYALLEVDASSLVSSATASATNAGKASVTLNDPTWSAVTGATPSNRTVTVSTTGRNNASGTTENLSKSVALYLTQGSWNSNKLTVSMRSGSASGTVYAATTVDAGSLVSSATCAGKASVSLDGPSWNSVSSLGASRTISVSTSGRTNASGTADELKKETTLYLTRNGLTVSLRPGSSTAAAVASTTCSVSSDSISVSAISTASTAYSCDVTRSFSSSYKHAKLTITVGSATKTIAINIL